MYIIVVIILLLSNNWQIIERYYRRGFIVTYQIADKKYFFACKIIEGKHFNNVI